MNINQQEIAAATIASEIRHIPFASLELSAQYQARTDAPAVDDPEILTLAATIKAIGCQLLQNLVVVPSQTEGTYEVCAGGRRLLALGLLVAEGAMSQDKPVACLVIPPEHAHMASLIENEARKAMHPADVYASYARMRDEGHSLEAIAVMFGASILHVRKLLALSAVSPTLMALFRKDKIDYGCMQALAASSDHARQEAAWKAAAHVSWNLAAKADTIRRALAEDETRGDSPVARYVTVAAYEKAGGHVRRDLFAQRGEDSYLDPVALHEMAESKISRSKLARAVHDEGWLWVEQRLTFSENDTHRFGTIQRAEREPTKDEAMRLKRWKDKLADVQAQLVEQQNAEERDTALYAKLVDQRRHLQAEMGALRSTMLDYPADLKAVAGAVLYIDQDGNLDVKRGLVRPEDRSALSALLKAQQPEAAKGVDLPPVATRPVHSAALVERLNAQRTIALQAELMTRPNLALCMLLDQMIAKLVDDRSLPSPVFDISTSSAHGDLTTTDAALADSPAWMAVQARRQELFTNTPPEDGRLEWLLQQPQDTLIEMLAWLTSTTIYRRRANGYGTGDTAHLDTLDQLVDLDMTKWWKATASSYFNHVSRDRMATVVAEVSDTQTAEGVRALKKADAACAAEKATDGKGWLPEPLRSPEAAAPAAPNAQGSDSDEIDD